MKRTMIIASLLALTGIGLATSADAATWRQAHPRRAEVNTRLNTQDHRINYERRTGQISGAQAHDLHAEDRGIRGQERYDASQDGSHITRAEKTQLNHEENGVSQQIGR